jgi:hypothetical protein
MRVGYIQIAVARDNQPAIMGIGYGYAAGTSDDNPAIISICYDRIAGTSLGNAAALVVPHRWAKAIGDEIGHQLIGVCRPLPQDIGRRMSLPLIGEHVQDSYQLVTGDHWFSYC